MADLTVQTARNFVRTYLDTDTTELPDSLLDVFMDEAQTRIERSSRQWRFYQVEYDLATVASDATYTFATIDANLRDVTVVQGERWQLEPISHESAMTRWANWTGISEPTHWSAWSDVLYLWPTPDAVYNLNVRGYRKMVRPADAGTPFDFPEDFHPLIVEYTLARVYEQQDDDVMSRQKFDRFENELNALTVRWETPSAGSVYFGGSSKRHPLGTTFPLRAIYDWE